MGDRLKTRWALGVVCAVAWVWSACASAPGRPAEAPEGVAIGGYCPVAYVDANRPVKGVPAHAVKREDGTTYWFVNREAKDAYVRTPQRYVVAFDGLATTALSQGQRVAADPRVFTVHQGTIYLFKDEAGRAAFGAAPEATIKAAQAAFAR